MSGEGLVGCVSEWKCEVGPSRATSSLERASDTVVAVHADRNRVNIAPHIVCGVGFCVPEACNKMRLRF